MIYQLNIKNSYNLIINLFHGLKKFLYFFFSNRSPVIPKLVFIQMLSTHVILNFNKKTNYLNSDNFDMSSSYFIYHLFEKGNFFDKFVGVYNLSFSFLLMALMILTLFNFLKCTSYYSFLRFLKKPINEPVVNYYLLIPLFVLVFSLFDYFVNNAFLKMALNVIYLFFMLLLGAKMFSVTSFYKEIFDKSIIGEINESIGCNSLFCIPNFFRIDYCIVSVNLNFKSWEYIPIIILINNKGIYIDGQYYSMDNIKSLNDNFNKKMVQYSKQEFEMLKIFNF